MKTRFRYWKWRDMPWIIIGIIALSLLLGWTTAQHRLYERSKVCNLVIVDNFCEH